MKKQASRPTIGWWCWRSNDGPVGSPQKKMSRDSNASDDTRVTTPTALETMLPWKRTDESEMNSGPVKQCEFPPWCSNKEYLAYNSPSATFLGGVEPTRCSVIGLFRTEGAESQAVDSPSPQDESAILYIEEEGDALLGRTSNREQNGRTDEDYLGNLAKGNDGGTGSTPSLVERWSPRQLSLRRQSSLPVNTSLESFTSSISDTSPHQKP